MLFNAVLFNNDFVGFKSFDLNDFNTSLSVVSEVFNVFGFSCAQDYVNWMPNEWYVSALPRFAMARNSRSGDVTEVRYKNLQLTHDDDSDILFTYKIVKKVTDKFMDEYDLGKIGENIAGTLNDGGMFLMMPKINDVRELFRFFLRMNNNIYWFCSDWKG